MTVIKAKSKPGIILVDDHKLFRSGLRFIINESDKYDTIGEASNGLEFLNLINKVTPDLVIMDINMPMMNGIEATKQALTKYPGMNILILSMYSESEYYSTLIDLGVKGFVLKDAENEELLNAIKKILEGGTYFSQELLLNLIRNKPIENSVSITHREKEILEFISMGFSNQQISEKLRISQRTVERHRTNLLEKTGSKNSISLIVFAIKNKMITI
jgi:DNA-binding NarL/FixJ family response regulator